MYICTHFYFLYNHVLSLGMNHMINEFNIIFERNEFRIVCYHHLSMPLSAEKLIWIYLRLVIHDNLRLFNVLIYSCCYNLITFLNVKIAIIIDFKEISFNSSKMTNFRTVDNQNVAASPTKTNVQIFGKFIENYIFRHYHVCLSTLL